MLAWHTRKEPQPTPLMTRPVIRLMCPQMSLFLLHQARKSKSPNKVKVVKVIVEIDEKWPIYTLEEENVDGPYVIEFDDDLYKQYLQLEFLYQSFQKRLKVLYDSEYEKLRGRSFECFAESSKATADTILNHRSETSK